MQLESNVKSAQTVSLENLLDSLRGAGWFRQSDLSTCGDRVFELPPDLEGPLEQETQVALKTNFDELKRCQNFSWSRVKAVKDLRALPNEINAPDIAPLIPPVSEASMMLLRQRMSWIEKYSLVREYIVKLAAPVRA